MTDHAPQPSASADELDASLAPYQPWMLNARHRELTEVLLLWLLRHCSCRRGGAVRHARDAFLAAAFEDCCAPPDAPLAESVLCAKHIGVFFLANDGADGCLPDLQRFDQEIADTAPDELTACYQSLVADLRRRGQPTGRFESAVHDMIACMRQEQTVDADAITMARHRAIRRHTVGVPSYVMCRRTARGLFFPADVERALDHGGLLDLAWEIEALTNDLGSVRRESRPTGDTPAAASLNFVWHRARESGDLAAAVQESIDRHNRLVDTFHDAARAIARQAEESGQPSLIEYQQILHAAVNGSLKATRHLVPLRYPESQPYLRQLREIPAVH